MRIKISNLRPVSFCFIRTLVVSNLYLALIFTQLSSNVDHTSVRPFDVTCFSSNPPSCVVSAMWDPRTSKGPTQVYFLKPARNTCHHGTVITRSQPSYRQDQTSLQRNYIGNRRVYWFSHTDYPRERKHVGLPSNSAEPVSLLPSSYGRRNTNPPAALNLAVGRSSSERSYTFELPP